MTDDLKYPIGLCVTKKELSGDERTALIGEIRSLPSKLRQAVSGWSKEQLDTPYRPGGWTVRQVVHHVGDSHMNSLIRLKLALTEDNPVIKPYEEQLWAELADSALPDPEISLNLLEALHERFVLVLESLNSDQWLRTYNHPANGETNLNEYLCTYAWHGNHHFVSDLLGDILGRYDSEIQPAIASGLQKAVKSAAEAKKVMDSAVQSLPDVKKVLSDASKGLAIGTQGISVIQKELPGVEAKVKELADRMRKFESEGNLQEVIDLLKNNFQQEGQFFAEPVVLKENQLFPIPNYGSAMSPFFSTLALWVGATLLVSLVTTEVHSPAAGTDYNSIQIYFGRFLTFLTLALLQSVLVTAGDIFLLGTYVVDKGWFILFGLVNSAVFMLIVYTLVSVFGNVGKALAIVLLVLQLAGSGGTFPIQTTPPFFRAIHPFLPFTYGISMMREAVGGMIWSVVRSDLLIMCVYVVITLVIGLALKGIINQLAAGLVKKAKESKLIH